MTDRHEFPAPEHLIEQSLLNRPPKSPSDRIFICKAVAHVGSATIPNWDEAERKAMVHFNGENAEAHLVRQAFDRLSQAIIDREIAAFKRPLEGGAMVGNAVGDFEQDDISTDILRRGKSNETTYFDISLSRIETSRDFYIFVDRDQLHERFPAADGPVVAPSGIDTAALSDYMRLALRTAADGFGATFTGEKKEIERALFERAAEYGLGDGALTDGIAKSMATMLRNKEAQGGRAGPLRKKTASS